MNQYEKELTCFYPRPPQEARPCFPGKKISPKKRSTRIKERTGLYTTLMALLKR